MLVHHYQRTPEKAWLVMDLTFFPNTLDLQMLSIDSMAQNSGTHGGVCVTFKCWSLTNRTELSE